MQSNIQGVSERGVRLDALQTKTDNLSTQANGFRRGANRVRKQMWWKDMKMRMCIIIGIIILLVVIIVPSGMRSRVSGSLRRAKLTESSHLQRQTLNGSYERPDLAMEASGGQARDVGLLVDQEASM